MVNENGRVLVTGAGGFVASHVILELLENDFDVIAMDNFANSIKGKSGLPVSLERLEKYTNKKIEFFECDMCDMEKLDNLIKKSKASYCLHFAGLKAVAESTAKPLLYYQTNLMGALNLLTSLEKNHIRKFIFSSSATVYGTPESLPISEKHRVGANITNPYGKSKYFIEEILSDLYKAEQHKVDPWSIYVLRYFNPVGAHPIGIIGEAPNDEPQNLMPNVLNAARGDLKSLKIFGNNYDTLDGTGVRDYVHVVDLAKGHIVALRRLMSDGGYEVYNLGTGIGYSVLQLIKEMEKVSGKSIPYHFEPPRNGDLASIYCDTQKAKEEIGWTAQYDLHDMCKDTWNWALKNPEGFRNG